MQIFLLNFRFAGYVAFWYQKTRTSIIKIDLSVTQSLYLWDTPLHLFIVLAPWLFLVKSRGENKGINWLFYKMYISSAKASDKNTWRILICLTYFRMPWFRSFWDTTADCNTFLEYRRWFDDFSCHWLLCNSVNKN